MSARTTALYGRGKWNIWIWLALGLGFVALNHFDTSGPSSSYWFFELILYSLMIAGMIANARYDLRKKIGIPRKAAPAAYVFLSWLFGMMFEASLTVTGNGIGGMHPETFASFILAQGDYIPIALISYFVIRNTRASFTEAFFFAGGKSLTEGLIFTGALTSVILSPMFWLSPVVLAYYTVAYSSFIALPLLFIDEELLWKNSSLERKRTTPFFWLIGFVLAFGIRIAWGLIYGPVVTNLFQLPPSP